MNIFPSLDFVSVLFKYDILENRRQAVEKYFLLSEK